MANICELRYMANTNSALDVDDMIIIFKGYVCVIGSDGDINEDIVNIVKLLCNSFPSKKEVFFENGTLKPKYESCTDDLANALYSHFIDTPKVIIGLVDYSDEGLSLTIDNHAYDVVNSPEFKQFMNSNMYKNFDNIIVNKRLINVGDLNQNPHQIQVANPLYHGTIIDYLYDILTKGLRHISQNTMFPTVKNDGFVFLTSEFAIADSYANDHADKIPNKKCVLKINSQYIDHNKIVLDYDFVKEYTTPGDNDPYTESNMSGKFFVGKVGNNRKRYGTKFAKIGYKGIIMPKAIEGAYLYNEKGDKKYYSKEILLNTIERKSMKTESRNLNEWKPSNFEQLPSTIKLYHGTDIYALESILIDGEINAYNGRQHGETRGMNWFSTKFSLNFSRGVVFSITVDKTDFNNNLFSFMNNHEVISNGDSIPIENKNFIIEKIGAFSREDLKTLIRNCNDDIFEFCERLKNYFPLNEIDIPSIDHPVMLQILRQTVGDGELRKEGIMESASSVNEVESSDISLRSFKVKNELNPKLWINNKLNSRVRLRLLDIADDFIDDLSVRWVKPEDIVLTGSIANYNWSNYSDIDVHIVMDYSKIYKKKEFVEDYFNSKKELWKRDHERLTIYGFPVEMYVQDVNSDTVSNGVYSLNKNEWIKEPKDIDDAKLNEAYVKKQAAKFMTAIDDMYKRFKRETDNHRIENIGKEAKRLLNRIKGVRKESLKRSGEMSSGNVIYKIIRRMGYLDKIWNIINNTYNKSKTID